MIRILYKHLCFFCQKSCAWEKQCGKVGISKIGVSLYDLLAKWLGL